eukprot:1394484-Amorphochlora_amoeboformis.AAC.2
MALTVFLDAENLKKIKYAFNLADANEDGRIRVMVTIRDWIIEHVVVRGPLTPPQVTVWVRVRVRVRIRLELGLGLGLGVED